MAFSRESRFSNYFYFCTFGARFVIRLASESWEDVLGVFINYFNLLIGEKFVAFQKLVQIRELMVKFANPINVSTALQLVYSLVEYGNPRKYS
jgi:hypothetical protein